MRVLKKLLLGVFALCCAVGFAACGGGSVSKSSSESVQETCEMRGYHEYVDGKCDNCEKEVTPTEYFTFSETTVDGKDGYEISYKGEFINVILPDYYNKKAILSIKEWAFEGCTSLTSVTIPDSVMSIGKKAFSLCGSLMSITIPDSVTSIGDRAFEHCWSLASITIPDGVKSIGKGTFDNCISLTSITIPDSVISIGEGAFFFCDSLTSITIPDNIISIGDRAFEECHNLMNIALPDGVTSIGGRAFYECARLTTVYYHGTAEEWANISIGYNNEPLTNATRYYYSESEPVESGNYWHYDEKGQIVVW